MERKKKRLAICWGIVGGIGLLTLTTGPRLISQAETEVPEVIINELAWAGSSVSTADEWIELKNTTTNRDVDLTGWQITGLTNDQSVINFGANACLDKDQNKINCVIKVNTYFLVANNDKDHKFTKGKSVLNIDPDYINSAINIASSGDVLKISLYKGDKDNPDNLIDTAGNGGPPFCGGNENGLYISMERNDIYGPGELSSNWHPANIDGTTNFDPVEPGQPILDLGTPKAENSTPPPPPPPGPTIDHIVPPVPAKATLDTNFVLEEIVGENFATTENLQVKLEKESGAIPATEWQRISSTTLIQVRFHIPPDAETGKWDLVIINLNQSDKPATLINAVEILEPEEESGNPTYSTNIMISELYPHPKSGEEEFIELYNAGDNSVNLKGWKLDDQSPGGSAEYTITADTILGPHQYLIFPKSQTHIYLNDTGDYARLIQPNGTVIDTTPNYGKAATGYSYSKINSNWQWTKRVTPNAANLYESIAETDETNDEETDNSSPDKVTIKLESDSVTATAAMLLWQINWPGAIGDLKIYQSDKSGQLGYEVGRTNPPKTDYRVTNLLPKTKYFFTIVGTYNVDDIKSNQITFTTTASGTTGSGVSGGTTGTPKQVVFSELLPNPNAGENEFIELYNPGDQPVDLLGWKLQDASGRTYVITAADLEELAIANVESSVTTLPPHQYLLLEYPITHIRLNNSGGEEVALLDAEDTVIDKIAYAGSAKQGYAYVLAPNDKWFWSNETTPGEANDISFAGIMDDSGAYLVDSGWTSHWPILIWLSLIVSAIMGNHLRKYGYANLYHPER